MNEHLPPPQPGRNGFRLLVWLMPVCIATTTGAAVLYWNWGDAGWLAFSAWVVFNFATTIALAVFDHHLSADSVEPEVIKIIRFVVLQVLVTPLVIILGVSFYVVVVWMLR